MMRAARLRRSRDIALVRDEGRAVRRSTFSVRIRRSEAETARVAVTAPRSIGTAIVRNRARRRVREAFRRELAASRVSGVDLVVSVRPEAAGASFATLTLDAAAVLREAKP